jgi:competence protein ComEC
MFATPSLLGLLLAGAGVGLLLLPRGYAFRYLAFILFIPLLFPAHAQPKNGEAYMTLLDVGQGLSAVIRTRQHTLVFDSGPRLGRQFDTGAAVVVPYLREQGISRIDILLISHGDNDHIGGADSILSLLPVAQVISSVPERLRRYAPQRCETGMHWVWDAVDIRVIYPQAGDYASDLSENNLSCVLQVRTQSRSFLLTGDIETPAEERLVARYAEALHSDVLIVPHHGSKTSSSAAFLAKVAPRSAIFPVGWHNRYHFPHAQVLERYQQAGIQVHTTANQGAITIESTSGEIHGFRDEHRQFWEP